MEMIEALQGLVFSSLVIDYNLDFIININSAHKNYIYLLHISLNIFQFTKLIFKFSDTIKFVEVEDRKECGNCLFFDKKDTSIKCSGWKSK